MGQTALTCDILVLGAGSAGLTAAARAAYLGKRVIVADKTKRTGGAGVYASTMRFFGSRWQEEHGIENVMDDFIRDGMDATYWRLDEKLIRNICEATGAFFDWFLEMAPEKADDFVVGTYVFDGPDGPKVPELKGSRSHYGSGRVFMEVMKQTTLKYGGQILNEWKALHAIMQDGKLVGIEFETPDGPARISCGACVLATGSWISNPDVVRKVMPAFLDAPISPSCHEHCSPNYTGEGLVIAQEAGAFLDEENFVLRLMGPCVLSPSQVLDSMGNCGFQINVNLNGERWAAEAVQRRMGLFKAGHALVHQPKGTVYSVFDMNNLEAAFALAHRENNGYEGFFGGLHFPDTIEESLADIEKQVSRHDGSAFRADTLEALADQIGLNRENFLQTVSAYNLACEEGRDPFFKDPAEMVPLTSGPYFAVRGLLGSDGAFGGVLVDPQMHVYKNGGGIVEGLYAAGDLAGGRHIKLGDFKEQVINDCSWALAGGYLCAQNAAQEPDSSAKG